MKHNHIALKIISTAMLLFTITGTIVFGADFSKLTYKQILLSHIKPGIKPDYKFPVSKQHHYGCFGFSVKHLAIYKYGISIDVAKTEVEIGKDRNKLWSSKNIRDFLTLYGLSMTYYSDAGSLFTFLEKGEPVVIQYKWPVDAKDWVGHFVVAYSFDEMGVWVSDSITNARLRVPYRAFMQESGYSTLFMFGMLVRIN